MINVHLNGEIVRCPDIAAIRRRINERNEAEHRCKYGIIEWKCTRWQEYVKKQPDVKKFSDCGRCVFPYNESCPMHRKHVDTGNLKKTFKIDGIVYRKMASTAHYLVKESKYKTLFLTLTFPPFRKKHKLTKHIFENEILNSYFSRFVENLRKNYDCGGYIACRERGKKGHRVHFHILLSIPFIPFDVLNDTWCNCIKNICFHSNNALTSDPKTLFIRNPVRAMKYVCKYFLKARGQESDCRLVFISNNIIQKPKQTTVDLESILTGYKGIYIHQTSDYTTCYRITDPKSFDRFCNNFLYPFFELSDGNPEYLYSFPENSS